MTDKVVVVGAGMGGLVSALLLAQRGMQVTVVESQSATGGKLHTTQVAGVAIDSGNRTAEQRKQKSIRSNQEIGVFCLPLPV